MIPTIYFALISVALAHPASRELSEQPVARDCDNSTSPTIQLDDAVVTGTPLGDTGVMQYFGIPYAKPPVGDLRFRLPELNEPYTGEIDATKFGIACVQLTVGSDNPINMSANASAVYDSLPIPKLEDSEDCLTINIATPANATPESKLPVAFFLHGGGFQAYASSSFNGSLVTARSLEIGEPVIYVSINFRLGPLGFPAGSETREAGVGNLGLYDQRLALRWLQKYISAFGGDPEKVMLWGQSAGSISAGMQMITNNGDTEGLFRSAFLESGYMHSTGALEDAQEYWDTFVTGTGCGDYLGGAGVFDCLRNVSTDAIRNASTLTPNFNSYPSLALIWQPREDGKFLTANPPDLVARGSIANVPFIAGDCDDEGTLYALQSANLTTTDEAIEYFAEYYFRGSDSYSIASNVMQYYSNETAAGSPFDTGDANALTPVFKQIAAVMGDVFYQAPRRTLLRYASGSRPSWTYLSKIGKEAPVLGARHLNDLLNINAGGFISDYLIRFAANLDPNDGDYTAWPQFSTEVPVMMTFSDGDKLGLINDTYRSEGMNAMIDAQFTHTIL